MPSGHRTNSEIILRACEMYAEGATVPEIVAELKIDRNRVYAWKKRKYPEDWDKKKADRITKKALILESETLETYERTKARHQRILKNAQLALVNRIVRANDEDVKVETAIEGIIKFQNQERELFLDVREIIAIKNKTLGVGMGMSVPVEGGGNASIMAFLQESFSEIHGEKKNGEPTQPTVIEGTTERPDPSENS